MSGLLGVEQDYPAKTRLQLRQAAEVMGIDEEYISRMARFFAARVAADRQLAKICARYDGDGGEKQVARMAAFWSSVALHTDAYSGDLVAAHRNLHDLERQDFARWLALFRATLDETAPTPAAANYLMSRTERIAKDLEAALFERVKR
ncbi:group III truncated hemoglobin [Roseovarius sp. S4756]|uniref:group III truncated hemoglobin n=1 Tax=Roseovarius maritimus TaxID=3342637 RepID=UPI0037290727